MCNVMWGFIVNSSNITKLIIVLLYLSLKGLYQELMTDTKRKKAVKATKLVAKAKKAPWVGTFSLSNEWLKREDICTEEKNEMALIRQKMCDSFDFGFKAYLAKNHFAVDGGEKIFAMWINSRAFDNEWLFPTRWFPSVERYREYETSFVHLATMIDNQAFFKREDVRSVIKKLFEDCGKKRDIAPFENRETILRLSGFAPSTIQTLLRELKILEDYTK